MAASGCYPATTPRQIEESSNKIRKWYITSAGCANCELRSFEKKNRGISDRPVAKAEEKKEEKQKCPISWAWGMTRNGFEFCLLSTLFHSTLVLLLNPARGRLPAPTGQQLDATASQLATDGRRCATTGSPHLGASGQLRDSGLDAGDAGFDR